jgi:hypothetical protein
VIKGLGFRLHATHRHDRARNGRGATPAADAALAQALDHLLGPLDTLREEFDDEAARAALAEAAGRPTNIRPKKDRFRLSSLSLISARMRYSTRAPYRQVRMALIWLLYVTSVCGIVWVVFAHA